LCCTRAGSPRSRSTASNSQRPGSWRTLFSPDTTSLVAAASL